MRNLGCCGGLEFTDKIFHRPDEHMEPHSLLSSTGRADLGYARAFSKGKDGRLRFKEMTPFFFSIVRSCPRP